MNYTLMKVTFLSALYQIHFCVHVPNHFGYKEKYFELLKIYITHDLKNAY